VSPVSRDSPGGDAYLDLRQRARAVGRPTDELIQLYVLEGFLARLSVSEGRDIFVLKGGVLLAAFGDRRATRDVDLAGLDFDADAEVVLALVRDVLAIEWPSDDGIEFEPESAAVQAIREWDEYPGFRVSVNARLATARVKFHVDVNVGDPVWPNPVSVAVPRIRGGEPIEIRGYPLHMVYAEKIVTAIQRGTANTRWRDFGDIWVLSGRHSVEGPDLQRALDEVATHRGIHLAPLDDVLTGYAEIAQARWSAWRRRNGLDYLPESFGVVLDAVIEFAGPAVGRKVGDSTWSPESRKWV
jgi:hypothetical protein